MEAVFRSRARAEWQAALEGLEVCCEPVLRPDEVTRNAQVAHRRLLVETGQGLEVAPGVRFDSEWRRLPAPALGEHTAEVLADVGVNASDVERLRAEGAI
jgi:crotonobetainyl-CoA:carnitine CoA-transferase CaiB-like acyl-CoA transferase